MHYQTRLIPIDIAKLVRPSYYINSHENLTNIFKIIFFKIKWRTM